MTVDNGHTGCFCHPSDLRCKTSIGPTCTHHFQWYQGSDHKRNGGGGSRIWQMLAGITWEKLRPDSRQAASWGRGTGKHAPPWNFETWGFSCRFLEYLVPKFDLPPFSYKCSIIPILKWSSLNGSEPKSSQVLQSWEALVQPLDHFRTGYESDLYTPYRFCLQLFMRKQVRNKSCYQAGLHWNILAGQNSDLQNQSSKRKAGYWKGEKFVPTNNNWWISCHPSQWKYFCMQIIQ